MTRLLQLTLVIHTVYVMHKALQDMWQQPVQDMIANSPLFTGKFYILE